jgi:hypothetical protein
MRSLTQHPRVTPTRIVALVAALTLAAPLAGCGARANRQDTGSSNQTTPAATVAPPATADPAQVEGTLDDVDQALKDADADLSAADAPNPDAD